MRKIKKMSTPKKLIFMSVLLFLLWNIIWFIHREVLYSSYTEKIKKLDGYYMTQDEDGYHYNVKKPSYLLLTGNLGITSPGSHTLIIWPKLFGEFDYGIIINDGETSEQIYIDRTGNPIKSDDMSEEEYAFLQKNVKENSEQITELLNKANDWWVLK